jgi:addiction module RelE/StbE family toxin
MNFKIVWSRRSLLDIENIFTFISKDNESAAILFVKELKEKVKLLSSLPELGRLSPFNSGYSVHSNGNELRELIIHKNYLVTYRVKDSQIQILQVWHVARNR